MALTLDPTGESAWALWDKVKENRPLIQCITNFVRCGQKSLLGDPLDLEL
jgi:hypothetical protein